MRASGIDVPQGTLDSLFTATPSREPSSWRPSFARIIAKVSAAKTATA